MLLMLQIEKNKKTKSNKKHRIPWLLRDDFDFFFFKVLLFDEKRNLNKNVWQVIRNVGLELKGKVKSGFALRGSG